MAKRIVVGLDTTEHSHQAQQFAARLAKLGGGTLIGVGVVDLKGIEKSEYAGVAGAASLVKQKREQTIKEQRESIRARIGEFLQYCREQNVECETVFSTGDPVQAMLAAASGADIMIVGTRTRYFYERKTPWATVKALLDARVCPLIAIPNEMQTPLDHVVVAYGPGQCASRAVREFANMTRHWRPARGVTLLRVDNQLDQGLEDLKAPAALLAAHGFDVDRVAEPGAYRDVVPQYVKERQPAMVVLGLYGRTIREIFLRGVTKTLLEDGSIPLFLST